MRVNYPSLSHRVRLLSHIILYPFVSYLLISARWHRIKVVEDETMSQLLEAQVGELLNARGWTICAAESCTGGLIAHRLTNIAGSSNYVLGGIVSYSNEAKQKLLGVHEATLIAHGAVSEETAAEMVQGVRAVFDADVAVSITGIAGPGGGTAEKPVGL